MKRALNIIAFFVAGGGFWELHLGKEHEFQNFVISLVAICFLNLVYQFSEANQRLLEIVLMMDEYDEEEEDMGGDHPPYEIEYQEKE